MMPGLLGSLAPTTFYTTNTLPAITGNTGLMRYAALSAPVKLPVHGQGVFLFKDDSISTYCQFTLFNKDRSQGLRVHFEEGSIHVTILADKEPLIDPNNTKGLSPKKGVFYWFSLDSQNQQLYAGIGEARIENVAYQYKFEDLNERKAIKEFLESLVTIDDVSPTLKPMRVLRDPITQSVPMLVKAMDELTMNDIAGGSILPVANLSTTGQKLYNCIAGKKFVLDDDDFPEFSEAIEHSIRTPGCWCYRRLQDKSTEFNKDKPNTAETYLRITLGQNNGESPGIPYVMEIWPVGHFSPIHNHAGGHAVIRVLHGNIHVKLFPFLCASLDGVEPFAEVDFKKGDITWISPTLNQTHQLQNLEGNKDTCITIQCYMYDDANNRHYDYFDYIDDNGDKQQYEPDSDMDFLTFKKTMKKEWLQQKGKEKGKDLGSPRQTSSTTDLLIECNKGKRWGCF